MTTIKRVSRISALIPLLVWISITSAEAAGLVGSCSSGTYNGPEPGGTMPWDAPLCGLITALTGAPAMAISIVAIFVSGIALIFGEDMGHFAKRLLMVVIAAALMIGGGAILSKLSGTAGAFM